MIVVVVSVDTERPVGAPGSVHPVTLEEAAEGPPALTASTYAQYSVAPDSDPNVYVATTEPMLTWAAPTQDEPAFQ